MSITATADPVWQDQSYHSPPNTAGADALPLISVRGNRFVDPTGHPVLFRGLNIADPDRLETSGVWNRQLFQSVQGMGANLVRLPVHPAAWRSRGPAAYTRLLDQAVGWCTELHLYVIIDWHSIGNLSAGMFQDPMYNTTRDETFDFWRRMAQHFGRHHTVAFFELFNEPTNFGGMLGPMGWEQWRDLNEAMIGIIRYSDPDTIPLVAGFDWAYDLDFVHYEPVRAAGIGYVTHPYPFKRPQPWEPRWSENFGFVAQQYPMIATEIGFDAKPGEPAGENDYGNRITRYLERHGISWMAWCYDPSWTPTLLTSFDGYQLNGVGEFFKQALHRPAEPVGREAAPARTH